MDQVAGKIARQMRKYKTRLLRQNRPHRQSTCVTSKNRSTMPQAFEDFDAAESRITAQGYAETPPEVEAIQTEQYPVKPMFIDEAVLQMEMSARQFLVFLNAKTEKVNVLYRRKKGDFGLIQPTLCIETAPRETVHRTPVRRRDCPSKASGRRSRWASFSRNMARTCN